MAQNRFRERLEADQFVVTFECVPGRGAVEREQRELERGMTDLWACNRVDALTFADAPSGRASCAPEGFCALAASQGITSINFLTCKDKNRNELEAQLWTLERAGVENVLCMSGDFPTHGWNGVPRAVYDLGSVELLSLVNAMDGGLAAPGPRGRAQRLTPAHLFPGCVVSPFKHTQAERELQIMKLLRKQQAGARYAICQIGYDLDLLAGFLAEARDAGVAIPLLANVYVLTPAVARVMARGRIPGCDVSPQLADSLAAEKDAHPTDWREAHYARAGKMVAAVRGMGFNGVHLAGLPPSRQVVSYILDMADAYHSDWRRAAADVKAEIGNAAPPQLDSADELPITAFPPRYGTEALQMLRHVIGFDPRDTAGLGLGTIAGLYPIVDCPKHEGVGPCGGSRDGWCEVHPGERLCIWYEAWRRLSQEGREGELFSVDAAPLSWGVPQ